MCEVLQRGVTRAALTFALLFLAGCQSGTIYKKGTFGNYGTLSIDARQRLAFVGTYYDRIDRVERPILCTEPSPDAAVARAAALAAGGSGPVPGGANGAALGTIAAALSASSSEAVASIGLRTQTIQLLRDGYYRACEAMINGVVDREDYGVMLANLDSTMVALAAIDALGLTGTTQAPAVAVTTGGATATVTPGQTPGASAGGGTVTNPLSIQTNFPSSQVMQANQADAIRAIALEVIKHAHQREVAIYQQREERLRANAMVVRPSVASYRGLQ